MSGFSYINDTIDKKLLDLNVAYLAKVLSVSGNSAKIQPLGMIKQVGEQAKSKAPITNVPIVESARYKLTKKTITYVTGVTISTSSADGYLTDATPNVTTKTEEIIVLNPLAAGDIVMCVCADRDITDARRGTNSVPPIGHHSLSDSVIVGIIKGG